MLTSRGAIKHLIRAALVFSLTSAFALGSACSNRQLYKAVQDNQRQHCLQLPPAQRSACMEGLGESYDDYKREREEVMDR